MKLSTIFWALFLLGLDLILASEHIIHDVVKTDQKSNSPTPPTLFKKQKRQSEFETNSIPEDETVTDPSATEFSIMDPEGEEQLEHPEDRVDTVEGEGHIKDIIIEDLNTQLPPIEYLDWIKDEYFDDDSTNLTSGKENKKNAEVSMGMMVRKTGKNAISRSF